METLTPSATHRATRVDIITTSTSPSRILFLSILSTSETGNLYHSSFCDTVFRIRIYILIRIHRIRIFLGSWICIRIHNLQCICMDPDSDPSINKQKNEEKPWFLQFFCDFFQECCKFTFKKGITIKTKIIFCLHLEGHWQKEQDPEPARARSAFGNPPHFVW